MKLPYYNEQLLNIRLNLDLRLTHTCISITAGLEREEVEERGEKWVGSEVPTPPHAPAPPPTGARSPSPFAVGTGVGKGWFSNIFHRVTTSENVQIQWWSNEGTEILDFHSMSARFYVNSSNCHSSPVRNIWHRNSRLDCHKSLKMSCSSSSQV